MLPSEKLLIAPVSTRASPSLVQADVDERLEVVAPVVDTHAQGAPVGGHLAVDLRRRRPANLVVDARDAAFDRVGRRRLEHLTHCRAVGGDLPPNRCGRILDGDPVG